MELYRSRPHSAFDRAPIDPFSHFITAVDTVVSNCPQPGSESLGPPTVVKRGDARRLDISDDSIDLVLSSPPYLNAIDYMRCSKFSLVWMGHNVGELRQIRAESIGTEASTEEALQSGWVALLINRLRLSPVLSKRHYSLLARYVWDMASALTEVSRVLRNDGRAVFIVGDSTVRGTFIRNSSIVVAVAEQRGLALRSRHARLLPANRRYLPPPARHGSIAALDGRM